MLVTLPYQTIKDYIRDLQANTLVLFCFSHCPACGGRLSLSLRRRIFLKMDYYRGRCLGECGSSYSFLPEFIFYRKHYTLDDIRNALSFIHKPEHPSLTKALNEWEANREILSNDELKKVRNSSINRGKKLNHE